MLSTGVRPMSMSTIATSGRPTMQYGVSRMRPSTVAGTKSPKPIVVSVTITKYAAVPTSPWTMESVSVYCRPRCEYSTAPSSTQTAQHI